MKAANEDESCMQINTVPQYTQQWLGNFVVKGVISKDLCREISCDGKCYSQNFTHRSKPFAITFSARLSFTCEAVS